MAKIVIVEDEVAIAEMYRFKLEHAGHQVRSAHNGQDGLALAQAFRPDLILLDLMMPKMSGEEMLKQLRATDWGKDIKVVILTNITEDTNTARLSDLKIERYIVKANYTPSQVAEIIPQVLTEKAK